MVNANEVLSGMVFARTMRRKRNTMNEKNRSQEEMINIAFPALVNFFNEAEKMAINTGDDKKSTKVNIIHRLSNKISGMLGTDIVISMGITTVTLARKRGLFPRVLNNNHMVNAANRNRGAV
jgi:hypothetical protein